IWYKKKKVTLHDIRLNGNQRKVNIDHEDDLEYGEEGNKEDIQKRNMKKKKEMMIHLLKRKIKYQMQ
ncbi:hypothetical protein KI387_033595, partial [Taxus chinensis]